MIENFCSTFPNRWRSSAVVALLAMIVFSTVFVNIVGAQDNGRRGDGLFLFPPETPVRLVRGAVLAERLDRIVQAKKYLNQLLGMNPSREELVRLREQFGVGVFLRLSAIPDLQPASRDLLQRINEAARAAVPSEADVELLISQLGTDRQTTVQTSLKILAAGDDAVRALLQADPSTEQGQLAAGILERFARRFRGGLMAALPNASPAEQARILRLLGKTREAALWMDLQPYRFSSDPAVADAANTSCQQLSSAPLPGNEADAARLLVQEAVELLRLSGKSMPSAADRRERLSGVAEDISEEPAPFGTRSLQRAVTLVRLAGDLVPDDDGVSAAQLVIEATEQSWPPRWPENPLLPNVTTSPASPDSVDLQAAELAIDSNNSGAAIAMLSRPDAIVSVFAHHPEILRRYSLSEDSRVRLLTAGVAAQAHGIRPNIHRTAVIVSAIGGAAIPEAVVVDSRSGESRVIGEILAKSGLTATPVATGQSGFEAATRQLNCEMILIQSNCLKWPLSITVANLREDYRTRNIPLIVYGPERDASSVEILSRRFSGIWFLKEPLSELTFSDRLRLAGFPGPQLTEEERSQMIRFARNIGHDREIDAAGP